MERKPASLPSTPLDDRDTDENPIADTLRDGEITTVHEGPRCKHCRRPNPLEMRRCPPPPDSSLQWKTCVVTETWEWCPIDGVMSTLEKIFVDRKVRRPEV